MSEQWNIENALSAEDRAICEKLAADRKKQAQPGSREHFEETIARCEANMQAYLSRPFDEAEEAVNGALDLGAKWHSEALKVRQRNDRLTLALAVAATYGALMTALYLMKLWR